MSKWSDYITQEHLQEYADSANAQVGPGRYVTLEQLESVVASAVKHYDYLPKDEMANALLWDVVQFTNYAIGLTDQDEETARYVGLLSSGHPDSVNRDPVLAAAWIADAPELEPSQRAVIAAALNPTNDYLKLVHASSRMKAILASGRASDKTIQNIENYTVDILKIPTALL